MHWDTCQTESGAPTRMATGVMRTGKVLDPTSLELDTSPVRITMRKGEHRAETDMIALSRPRLIVGALAAAVSAAGIVLASALWLVPLRQRRCQRLLVHLH